MSAVIVVNIAFVLLGALGWFWWPAWLIAGVAYAAILGAIYLTRPATRRRA